MNWLTPKIHSHSKVFPWYLKISRVTVCYALFVYILSTPDWSRILQSYSVSLSKSVCSRFIHENIWLPSASVVNLPVAAWQLRNLQKPKNEGTMKQHTWNTTWKMLLFELSVFKSFSQMPDTLHLFSHWYSWYVWRRLACPSHIYVADNYILFLFFFFLIHTK